MAYTEGLQFGLFRNDGVMLARFPAAPAGAPDRLDERTGFHRSIVAAPAGGMYTAVSPLDHIERRFAYRRFGRRRCTSPPGLQRRFSGPSSCGEWRRT